MASRSGSTGRSSSPPGIRPQPPADLAVARNKLGLLDASQLADQRDAVPGEAPLHGLAYPPQQTDRLAGEKGPGLGPADHRETPRLVQFRGDLGQELVVAEPDRDGDRKLLLHPARQPRQGSGRAGAMKRLRATEVHEGLVDGERFDQGRQVKHHRPELAAHRDVLLHVGLDDGGVGTGLQGLEHRHGRVHAVGAGDVAAGGHHAPVASPNDHGDVAQLRAVAFLDSGVEGVAVEMGDGEAM